MDFGDVTFIQNKFLENNTAAYQSKTKPDLIYLFCQQRSRYYYCKSCKVSGKVRIVTIIDGRICSKKDPEADHHPQCQGYTNAEVTAFVVEKKMKKEIRNSGRRPRDVYSEALATFVRKCDTTVEQVTVLQELPSYAEMRASLYRHQAYRKVRVSDPYDIPESLKYTLRGQSVGSDDPAYGEKFLLYSSTNGHIQIYCAKSELQILKSSKYIVCDGTFEMAPKSCFQLYTLHGFYNGEGVALLFGLLPNKTKETYKEFFSAINDAFQNQLPTVEDPDVRYFLTDFESAAFTSISEVFDKATVKGCTFHYRQALMRRLSELHLKDLYMSENSAIRDWLRAFMGLTFLPEIFVPYAWGFLNSPPVVLDGNLSCSLLHFSEYFRKTWMQGQFPPSMWTHYDHNGPRTTNLAEGWHNSLNHSLRMSHPTATNFLFWLQSYQAETQCRIIQLSAGKVTKAQKKLAYRRLEEQILKAKVEFNLRVGQLFLYFLNSFDFHAMIEQEVNLYIRHCSYFLVGGNKA